MSKLTIINPIGIPGAEPKVIFEDDDEPFVPVTEQDIAREDSAKPRISTSLANRITKTAPPPSSDPVFEAMIRANVADQKVQNKIIAEYRAICRARAKDRTAEKRALKDLARVLRNQSVYAMYKRGETLTGIAEALGIQKDHAHGILVQMQNMHGDVPNTRSTARPAFQDEVAAIKQTYREQDEAPIRAAEQAEREAGLLEVDLEAIIANFGPDTLKPRDPTEF